MRSRGKIDGFWSSLLLRVRRFVKRDDGWGVLVRVLLRHPWRTTSDETFDQESEVPSVAAHRVSNSRCWPRLFVVARPPPWSRRRHQRFDLAASRHVGMYTSEPVVMCNTIAPTPGGRLHYPHVIMELA
jgi:hypothetical protein